MKKKTIPSEHMEEVMDFIQSYFIHVIDHGYDIISTLRTDIDAPMNGVVFKVWMGINGNVDDRIGTDIVSDRATSAEDEEQDIQGWTMISSFKEQANKFFSRFDSYVEIDESCDRMELWLDTPSDGSFKAMFNERTQALIDTYKL